MQQNVQHRGVHVNHPSATQLLRPCFPSPIGMSDAGGSRSAADAAAIAAEVYQSRGGAAARLPDGRIVFLGGVTPAAAQDHPFAPAAAMFVEPVLWGPSYVVEHAFDNEVEDFREPGPFVWQRLATTPSHPSSQAEETTSSIQTSVASVRRSSPPPAALARKTVAPSDPRAPALHHVADHTLVATADLRVFCFGGRSDVISAASCHNKFFVGRLDRTFCDSSTTGEAAKLGAMRAPFHPLIPAPSPVATQAELLRGSPHHPSRSTVTHAALRHAFDGTLPSRRYGHASTMVGGGRVMLVSAGLNEKGISLRDLHYFVPSVSSSDEGFVKCRGARRERVVVEGAWLRTAGCPACLCSLPQRAHHHSIIVLPSPDEGVPPSGGSSFIESWLLVADGRSLFRLDVKVHVPPPVLVEDDDDDNDGDTKAPPTASAFVWFEPVTPTWVQLLSGGVVSSVPFRHSSLVTLLNCDELLVHGGTRCLSHLADCSEAQKKLLHRNRHRAVSAVGDVSDAAFVFRLSTGSWSYEASVTEQLGYATGHMAVQLDDGRPPLLSSHHYARHLAVLGAVGCGASHDEAGCRQPPTLSCSGEGLTVALPSDLLQQLASRLCSGVVRRVGVAVGDISFANTTIATAEHDASHGEQSPSGSTSVHPQGDMEGSTSQSHLAHTLAGTTTTNASISSASQQFSPARRLSCTSGQADGPRRRQSLAAVTGAAAPTAAVPWTSPSVMIRDTLLERDDANQQEHLRQHLRAALISVLRQALGNDLTYHYFHTWLRAVNGGPASSNITRAPDGTASATQLASRSLAANTKAHKELQRLKDASGDLRMCAECKAVPAEVILEPCGHFVLCNLCSNTSSECPSCGAAFDSTRYGCSGNRFPFLHQFLTAQVDAQQLDTQQRKEYRRQYLARTDVGRAHAEGASVELGERRTTGDETSRSGRMTPPALRASEEDSHAMLFSSLVELPSAIKSRPTNDGEVHDVTEQFYTPARHDGRQGVGARVHPLSQGDEAPPLLYQGESPSRQHLSSLLEGGAARVATRRSLRVPRTMMM